MKPGCSTKLNIELTEAQADRLRNLVEYGDGDQILTAGVEGMLAATRSCPRRNRLI
jgi:hypothetical protein